MKQETKKSLNERRCIVAYLDSVQARLASLRRCETANTTMEIQGAHSTVKSSDFGETALWEFSVR